MDSSQELKVLARLTIQKGINFWRIFSEKKPNRFVLCI
jgi:hypothetical protein